MTEDRRSGADQDKVKRAEARVKKAREALRKVKYSESKRQRKERSTALHTIGACFIAMMNDPKLGESTKRIWDDHMSRIAPAELTDQRRQALKNVFGLDVPDHPV